MTTSTDPGIAVVHGIPGALDRLAVLIKRSYRVGPGRRPSLHDEQVPLYADVVQGEAEPPTAPAPRWDSDHFAFKPRTDLVFQGCAYAGGATSVEVRLAWRNGERVIRVHGDRRLERGPGGQLRFTPAVAFERLPLGFDRAYGGCDAAALAATGDAIGDQFGALRPEWNLSTSTPFHYPRNPAGRGYLTRMPAQPEAVAVPSCEFPDDPVTPERMLVDGPRDWLRAPLPAGMDWYEQSWFPRGACVGLVPDHVTGSVPRECGSGWAPADILGGYSLQALRMHDDFVQGAAPGMRIAEPKPGDRLGLHGLWPHEAAAVIELPDERPKVQIEPPGRKALGCETTLSSLVVQPEAQRVVLVWSCRATVSHRYTPDQLAAMPRTITWKR